MVCDFVVTSINTFNAGVKHFCRKSMQMPLGGSVLICEVTVPGYITVCGSKQAAAAAL